MIGVVRCEEAATSSRSTKWLVSDSSTAAATNRPDKGPPNVQRCSATKGLEKCPKCVLGLWTQPLLPDQQWIHLPGPTTWRRSPIASTRFGSPITSMRCSRDRYGRRNIAAQHGSSQGATQVWSRGPCSGTWPPATV
jgi:hypothetical protein